MRNYIRFRGHFFFQMTRLISTQIKREHVSKYHASFYPDKQSTKSLSSRLQQHNVLHVLDIRSAPFPQTRYQTSPLLSSKYSFRSSPIDVHLGKRYRPEPFHLIAVLGFALFYMAIAQFWQRVSIFDSCSSKILSTEALLV